jgi:hypothetical protein
VEERSGAGLARDLLLEEIHLVLTVDNLIGICGEILVRSSGVMRRGQEKGDIEGGARLRW